MKQIRYTKLKLIFLFLAFFIAILGLKAIYFDSSNFRFKTSFPFLEIYYGCKNCNVILISIDTLRAKSLPCYGYEKNTAPNLCEFAENSLLFTSTYSQSASTMDSHFSIFTSLYPTSHLMITPFVSYLSEEIQTLPQILKKNGYKTLYSGPLSDEHLPLDSGLERGFDEITEGYDPSKWVESLEKFKTDNQKFFAFLHTYDVHEPYLPESENIHKFYSGGIRPAISKEQLCKKTYEELVPSSKSLLDVQIPDKNYCKKLNEHEVETGISSYSLYNKLYWQTFEGMEIEEKKNYLQALYETEIYELDLGLKKFLDYIEEKGLSNNTIIIITSDHGEEFYEHGYWSHGSSLYNESIRVPLIIYAPKLKPQHVDKLAQSIDILPTISNILGIESLPQFQGMDLLSNNVHQYVFSEKLGDRKQAVISQDWKLIVNNDVVDLVTKELYDRKSDPEEVNNLVTESPDVIRRLEQALQEHNSSRKTYRQDKNLQFPERLDEEQRKRLIETGYF